MYNLHVIEEIIGKEMSLKEETDVKLNIVVLSESEVKYQFVGTDGTKDTPVVTELKIIHNEIFDIEDYSFLDETGTRNYLFEFE